jgi:beta-fructofuranosidase
LNFFIGLPESEVSACLKWLSSSIGAGFLVAPTAANASGPVEFSNTELWDGLINAWPDRPEDTTKQLRWDGPIMDIYGLWADW